MRYDHTQAGPWFLMIHAIAAAFLICAIEEVIPESWGIYVWLGLFVPTAFFGFCFVHLNVRDLDDRLVVRFGPIRLFGTTIHYDQITGCSADRSTFLNGWGIHLRKGGWIYNIWGYDCVHIQHDGKSTWIGTNDVPGLLALLEERSGIVAVRSHESTNDPGLAQKFRGRKSPDESKAAE